MNKHLIAILFLSLLYPQAGSFNIEKLNNSQLDILRNQLMQNEITQDSSDSEEINRLSIDKVNIEEKQTFIPQENVPSKEIEYYYGMNISREILSFTTICQHLEILLLVQEMKSGFPFGECPIYKRILSSIKMVQFIMRKSDLYYFKTYQLTKLNYFY